MYYSSILLRITALSTLCFLAGCSDPDNRLPADLVLRNGNIYTVDNARSWAQAVAITDGRFSYVGTDNGVDSFVGSTTQVVDLHGRMVLPGMFDEHIHAMSSGIAALGCDLSAESLVEEFGSFPDDPVSVYLDIIKRCADAQPNTEWLVGKGWLVDQFGPAGRVSRQLLDEIVPDRPVYMESADGHTAWVNSKALQLAGITAETPDPANGRIDRETGSMEPLGSLQEHAATLVADAIPAPDLESRTAGLQYSIRMLNSMGITSIQDAWATVEYLEGYRAMDDRSELFLRVVAGNVWDSSKGMEQLEQILLDRKRFSGGNLRATSVKIWLDGVMENYTAAMIDPYLVEGSPTGMLMMEPETLTETVTALDAHGFQVHVHAIGDRATRESLNAFEAARNANGVTDNRHHIAHLEVVRPEDFPRFRQLGVAANFSLYWAYADSYITELTLPFISPELARWIYPIGSLSRAGAVVVSGSDWGVSSANPFLQIETAVTRLDPLIEGGGVFIPEERVSLAEAIAMLTINAAWVNHSEADAGSIEVNKLADLAVLDRNIFDIDVMDISDTQVLVTLFGGQAVHGSLAEL